MPRKPKIKLVPHEIRAVANALLAEPETSRLITAQISEEELGVSADSTPHLNASIDRIIRGVSWSYDRGAVEQWN